MIKFNQYQAFVLESKKIGNNDFLLLFVCLIIGVSFFKSIFCRSILLKDLADDEEPVVSVYFSVVLKRGLITLELTLFTETLDSADPKSLTTHVFGLKNKIKLVVFYIIF